VIRGTTRLAAVIGWPVDHSRSPQLLNAAFAARDVDAVLVPLAVEPANLATVIAALRASRALGASVTIPHKVAVAELCDQLSPAARAIGAVNCLHFGDALVGHNTDCDGFADSLAEAGCVPRDIAVLGAGGAARAVVFALLGATRIQLIARNPDRVSWVGAMATMGTVKLELRPWTEIRDAVAGADLVVDTTPIGLSNDEGTDTIPLDAFRRDAWVSSLVYHRTTRLLERARDRGHRILDGRGMLVHQGAHAFTLWTKLPAPVDAMRQALDAALRGT
jgi:shikimate dehydrogenase